MANTQDILASLIGAWKLMEWSEIRNDGSKAFPLGEDAIGQIMYSSDGHIAAQLVRSNRKRFASDDWREATTSEGARAFKEYFGYFGTFSIDLAQGVVIHHVEGAWFPNVERGDQLRRFRFEDKHLVLDAETEWGRVRIVWERSPVYEPAG